MINYQEHAKIFDKSCFNCSFCCADTEPEDNYTRYWCSYNVVIFPKNQKVIMNRIATLNSNCPKWEVRKDKE